MVYIHAPYIPLFSTSTMPEPGHIDHEDNRLYDAYDRDFSPGERVFWLGQAGEVVKLAFTAKNGMAPGYDIYEIRLDNARGASKSRDGIVEAFRGQLRLADSVTMHTLAGG